MEISVQQANQNPPGPKNIQSANIEPLWDMVARPLKIPMTVFGLYHEEGTKKVHPESAFNDKVLFFLVPRIYHILIVIVLWLNWARIVVSFWVIGKEDLVYDIISICSWGFLVAVNNTIFLKICYKRDIVLFIASQSKLCFLSPPTSENEPLNKDHIKPSWMKYRSFALAATVVGVFAICLSTVPFLYMTYGPHKSSIYSRIMCLPWSSGLACGFSTAFAVYGIAAWIFTVVFISVICHLLTGQLAQLTHDFTETFGDIQNFEAKLLDSFRRNFNMLCRSIELADKMLSPLIAVAYCANIPTIIFLLYQIWYRFHDMELLFVLNSAIWVIGNAMNLVVISHFAAAVHEKAHSLRRHVHDLQTETFDPEIAQIQMLFLARLDGPEIGMTALGCFVITKERVLAVISTLITYFTILLQFKGLCSDDTNTMATGNFSMTTDTYTT